MSQAFNLAAFARQLLSGGIAPSAAVEGALPTGAVQQFVQTTAPTGWLKMNGQSIGNASSGATGRANADTAALFAVLWSNMAQADATVQDSAGSTVSRGASATADFAANRRIVVPDMRGEFSRGLDDGRGVDSARANGSAQAQDIQSHTHTTGGDGLTVSAGAQQVRYAGSGAFATSATGGTETRPRNRAFIWYIKL